MPLSYQNDCQEIRSMDHSELLLQIEKYGLSSRLDELKGLIRPTCLLQASSITITQGASKIGGDPEIPAIFDWPLNTTGDPYDFVAQINLNEIPNIQQLGLPNSGVLYFFTSSSRTGLHGSIESKVFHQKDLNLRRHKEQRPFKKQHSPRFRDRVWKFLGIPWEEDDISPSNEYAIQFVPALALPGYAHKMISRLMLTESEKQKYELLLEMLHEQFSADNAFNSIGGYAVPLQNDDMEIECHLISSGESKFPQHVNDELFARSLEWTLLLQLDLGNVDSIYLWIKKADLANQDFSNCLAIYQCY